MTAACGVLLALMAGIFLYNGAGGLDVLFSVGLRLSLAEAATVRLGYLLPTNREKDVGKRFLRVQDRRACDGAVSL